MNQKDLRIAELEKYFKRVKIEEDDAEIIDDDDKQLIRINKMH